VHVLAFVNQKGGCGKTTTAVNLAGALVVRGARVLLVDLDPQAHATLALSCAADDAPSAIDVLSDACPAADAIFNAPGGIALLPATERLREIEETAARTIQPESLLARALSSVTSRYDYAIVDCPPRADGVLAANALRAADTAVLVIEAGAFALQGALKARHMLLETSERLERPFQMRAVGTLFDKRARITRELLIAIQAQFGAILFDTAIRTSTRLREAAALGVPVQMLDKRGIAVQDFAALADEVVLHAANAPIAPIARSGVASE
jgi:chromosome partitioning protein